MGLGVVGDSVRNYFAASDREIRTYDPRLGMSSEDALNEADLIFVCVPTPYVADRGFDDSALYDAIGRLRDTKTVVIKSTVLPGTTEAFQARFPQHAFLFNPEFLTEARARNDFLRPDRQIVGYTAESRHLAEALLAILPAAPHRDIVRSREAEMTKYMTNTFLALKVTFANEIYDLCTALDIDYATVRQGMAADVRIGATHLNVNDGGYRGYGGKCLPKDTKALLDLADEIGIPLRLLRTADRVNQSLISGAGDTALAPLASVSGIAPELIVEDGRAA